MMDGGCLGLVPDPLSRELANNTPRPGREAERRRAFARLGPSPEDLVTAAARLGEVLRSERAADALFSPAGQMHRERDPPQAAVLPEVMVGIDCERHGVSSLRRRHPACAVCP